jgi:GNAT superfamily N-acetyltransferase
LTEISFRLANEADGFTVYRIFERSIADFARRSGIPIHPVEQDEQEAERNWPQRRSLFDHLARTAEHFILVEVDGEAIGYARSILRDDARELTDFFVLPGRQAAGIGREMLARVFPAEGAAHRTIIATTDTRALVRYLKEKVYPRFPIYNFSRVPRDLPVPQDLECRTISGTERDLDVLRSIDRQILGYTRDVDHAWWLQDRFGFLYYRQGQLIGYGYTGYDGGPIALFDESDYPVVLAHAESVASELFDRFHLEVPLINRSAVDYLLQQGYEMGAFIALFMSDEPFGRFENYILPAPPFTL